MNISHHLHRRVYRFNRIIEQKVNKKLSCCCESRSCSTVQLQTVGWNSCGQNEYLLIYGFKLKSAFDVGSLLLMLVSFLSVCFVIKRYIEQQKIIMSEEVNRKCHPKNAVVRLSTPALTLSATCTASQTDRQTDRREYDTNSRSYCATVRSAKNVQQR